MNMRLLTGLALSALMATSVVHAKPQKKINLQQAMVDQCVAEITHFNVADKKTAKKLCTCTTNVQAKHLKLGEFWEMNSYALNRQNPKDLPQVKRIAPKLAACRKGLTLKKPTPPKKP